MQKFSQITRTGVARSVGLALALACVVGAVAITHADFSSKHNLTVRVFEGDPAQNKLISGVDVTLHADTSGNPSNLTKATTNGSGTVVFTNVAEDGYTLQLSGKDYQDRSYHVIIDSDTTLEASLIAKAVDPAQFTLNVRVFNGDPAKNILIPNAKVSLSNGQSANTNGSGSATFKLNSGTYTADIGANLTDFYERSYTVIMDSDTTLEASLISKDTGGGDGGGDVCLPTPPRGKPMLNIWPISESGATCTDYHMLAAKNATTGGAFVTSNGTVAATDGQTITVELYVHNGVLDFPENIAHNVQVKSSVPNGSGAITATAWADNADTITSAQKGGNVNVSLGANQVLQYVSGSTKLYDNTGAFQANLPDGITGSGVSIGDMRGCFQFLHFVTYQLVVKTNTPPPPKPPVLTISKTVSNITTGSGFVESVPAKAGDSVSFKLVVSNTGTGDATHVVAKDVLPAGLSNSGSADLNNIAMGTIAPGASQTFTFNAKVNSITCATTVTNTATAQSNEVGPVSDTAKLTGPVCPPPPKPPVLTISKTVSKDGGKNYADSLTINAGTGVSFKIVVSNTGESVAKNVVVTDVLPGTLPFAGNFQINGQASSNTLPNIQLGLLQAGQLDTITFDVAPGGCDNSATNTSTAVADNASKVSDSAKVTVLCNLSTNTSLSIVKTVSDSTTGTGFQKSVASSFGDQLVYRLVVTNTGSAVAQNVVITDVLPNGINYNNNLSVSLSSSGNPTVSPYLKIASLNPGQSVTTSFQAVMNNANCGQTLTNRATAVADNAGQVSDTAIVTTQNCPSGNPNLSLSKKAWNDTQNKDATTVTAKAGDMITYTLTASNTGNATMANYVFTDDVSDVVKLSNLIDIDGATLNGNVLTYPATDIAAGATVNRAFRVQVKNPIPAGTTDCTMSNTFGNTVNVSVSCMTPFVAPPTGNTATLSIILASLTLLGFAGYRNGRILSLVRLTGLIKS
ncbi:MAG TPA: hypothetical protein VFX17_03885 [Patescibacteria group bacterium]|nr:hypothetical protein [Patescibacteria group bacterium]